MLELNKWFFVLLINFLILLYILNIILFRPILRVLKERDSSIKELLNAAKEMQQRREEAISRMNQELLAARAKAREIYEGLRKEGLEKQKALLDDANKKALDIIVRAKEEIRAEAEKARQRLRADVDRFSDEIVRKLVGE
jgi:F-type H+-transporting ATPase subunit b